MVRKNRVSDGPQTLKQAKAAFKARGSTVVSEQEKRQLERGAVLLERAGRIKEQEQRRKDVLKKKAAQEARTTKPCLLGTQRRLDKFGYKSSQFHLGSFFKPKPPATLPDLEEEATEPWDANDVDDDTLLDFADESPVSNNKTPVRQPLPTPTKASSFKSACSPSLNDDGYGLLERSPQLAREVSPGQKRASHASPSFVRIPSFTSTDFDLSVDDLEEMDMPIQAASPRPEKTRSKTPAKSLEQTCGLVDQKPRPAVQHSDRQLMPPPRLPAKRPTPKHIETSPRSGPAHKRYKPHGISMADLESLAGEEIQLSQWDGN